MTTNETHGMEDRLFENNIAEHTEPYLTTAQLAKTLNIYPDTVRHWVSKYRDFPVEKLGSANRYRVSEVIAFFRERKRGRSWR